MAPRISVASLTMAACLLGAPAFADAPVARFRMGEGSLSITGFETQFKEHAQNARENGDGHRVAVAVNAAMSRAIVAVYRGIMAARKLRR